MRKRERGLKLYLKIIHRDLAFTFKVNIGLKLKNL